MRSGRRARFRARERQERARRGFERGTAARHGLEGGLRRQMLSEFGGCGEKRPSVGQRQGLAWAQDAERRAGSERPSAESRENNACAASSMTTAPVRRAYASKGIRPCGQPK